MQTSEIPTNMQPNNAYTIYQDASVTQTEGFPASTQGNGGDFWNTLQQLNDQQDRIEAKINASTSPRTVDANNPTLSYDTAGSSSVVSQTQIPNGYSEGNTVFGFCQTNTNNMNEIAKTNNVPEVVNCGLARIQEPRTQVSSIHSELSSASENPAFANSQQTMINPMEAYGMLNATFSISTPSSMMSETQGGLWSRRATALLGNMVCSDKRGKRKANKDKPKRPLSAYNYFFKEERARLLTKDSESSSQVSDEQRTSTGKIKFENLAKIISSKWQSLDERDLVYYKQKATEDLQRYRKEMEAYNKKQEAMNSANLVEEESGIWLEPPASKRTRHEAV